VRPCVRTQNLIAIQKLYVTKIKIEAVAPQAHDWHKAAGEGRERGEMENENILSIRIRLGSRNLVRRDIKLDSVVVGERKLLGEIISRGNFRLALNSQSESQTRLSLLMAFSNATLLVARSESIANLMYRT
jgi:hypothetical protein